MIDPVFPVGKKNDAFAEYFIGQSYLEMLSTGGVGIGNVTLEPGCRNNWQHLRWWADPAAGWYRMTRGSVVSSPVGVKHWHGAGSPTWPSRSPAAMNGSSPSTTSTTTISENNL